MNNVSLFLCLTSTEDVIPWSKMKVNAAGGAKRIKGPWSLTLKVCPWLMCNYCHVPAGRGLRKAVLAPGRDETRDVKSPIFGDHEKCFI